MTLTIKIDETLFVKNIKIEFDDSDNYCGRAAKLAVVKHLAKDLINDAGLLQSIDEYCQKEIEKLVYIE